MKHTLFALLIAVSATAVQAEQPTRYTERQTFKNWALSGCIGQAFESDYANAAASGYLEFGNMPAEAYKEGSKLIEFYLAKNYASKEGSTLHAMECIDMFHSKELDALARKYTR